MDQIIPVRLYESEQRLSASVRSSPSALKGKSAHSAFQEYLFAVGQSTFSSVITCAIVSHNGVTRVRRLRMYATSIGTIVLLTLITPLTCSCQRGSSDPNRGVEELRSIVQTAGGKPQVSDLSRFESRHTGTRAAALAAFLRGYLHFSTQNYEAAAEAFATPSIAAQTSIGDYAALLRGDSLVKSGKPGEAVRVYSSIYASAADSPKAREARLKAAEQSIAIGDPGSALSDLQAASASGDADAVLLTAKALEARGQTEQAIAQYRKIYYEIPATTASVQAEGRLNALGASPGTNPASLAVERKRADLLLEAKQFGEAAQAYESLIKRFPEAASSNQVQLRLGISLSNNKQPAQAVVALSKVRDDDQSLYGEALYHLAESLRRSNRTPQSSQTVDKLVASHRNHPRAAEALYNLSSYFNKEGREAEGAIRFRQLLALYPNKKEYGAEASYVLGWRAYRTGNYAEATRILEQHLLNYRSPQTRFIGEAGFWGAKSHERLGNRARALALYDLVATRYRYGYHGHFSALRASALRKADSRLKAEAAAAGSELSRIGENLLYVEPIVETAGDSAQTSINRADDLEVIGLSDFSIRELNEALQNAPSSQVLNLRLARIYSRRGENFQATIILRRGFSDVYSYQDSDLPREAWEVFFPLSNWSTIREESKKYGLDPFTVAGLIRQESVFNENAISRVGARGLMQLMPATGQLVAKRQGNGRITTADLHNPSLNIKLGTNYLAEMIGQFGRLEYAAAAYNAGPGRAKRWIAERGSMDIEDWIENIPITETRGYVQGVIRYSANYRRFYSN